MRSNSSARLLLRNSALCVAGIASLGVAMASAQGRSRIAGPITENNPVAMAHSIHPRVNLGADRGPIAEDKLLRGMSIRFNMTDAQHAALDQLLSDQQNPASPRYQQWLTPAQYAAQFGMQAADLAKVAAWLTGHGFTVTHVANGGSFLFFDGTVGQVERAFGTSIHSLSIDGESHFANVTELSLPREFAGSVMAVTGLHDFRLKPRMSGTVSPQFTSSQTGNHFITPKDLYTIYNMNPLLASFTGAGITIAVTGQVDINTADVSAFRSASGLSTTNLPTTVHAFGFDPGLPSPTCPNCSPTLGDLGEASLDVEWSGAMAPAASILFVTGQQALPGAGGTDAMTYAIDNNLAPIVTTSYGLCEAGWGSTDLVTTNALFRQGNAQGQTIIAPSADQGAPDCDRGVVAIQGLAADFPASSPYVTALGGTQFNGDTAGTGSGTTWSATQYWAGTSGSDVVSSALSYIPEAAWNDASVGLSQGAGGGPSAFFTKPTWQIGTGVPADGSRDVPDIALDAAIYHDSLVSCVNVAARSSCTSGFRGTDGTFNAGGGTSYDSQIFGGMLALIEQKIGHRIGNANPTIYALANTPAYYTPGMNTLTLPSVVFNDVTTGSNALPCTQGTPNCGNGGVVGYNAAAGYDLATGWGSVNLSNMANAWNLVAPLGVGSLGANTSVTTLATSAGTAAAGSPITLTAAVAAGPNTPSSVGAPTGTVQFFANGVSLGNAVSLSGSTATFVWVTSCSALGQQVLSASYSGDVNYQGSKGPVLLANGGVATPVEVVVTSSTCPDFALSTATPTVSVAAGGTIPSVTITATPSNGFTGTVTFSAVSTSTSPFMPTFNFSPASVNLSSSTGATTTLTLSGIAADLRMPDPPATGKAPWYMTGSGITVASLLLVLLPRRRHLGGLLLFVLAVALIGGATGCGSSQSGPPSTTTNPQTVTYTVIVTGTYTSSSNLVTQHITTINYFIQ